MCDLDNPPQPPVAPEYYNGYEKPGRRFTLHQRNVGKDGNIITHWSSGPSNFTFDPDCWWCRLKARVGL